MPDKRSPDRTPYRFFPSLKSDWMEIEVKFKLQIGIDNPEELLEFFEFLHDQINKTGAIITHKEFNHENTKLSPFTGSLREKLEYDANCGNDEEE